MYVRFPAINFRALENVFVSERQDAPIFKSNFDKISPQFFRMTFTPNFSSLASSTAAEALPLFE